jgi:hypothetical protein
VEATIKSSLQSCHPNSKPWEVFPGHFYDKEIHLVPVYPDYDPASNKQNASGGLMGYSVVYVKPGSSYDAAGIQNGDIIESIDGRDLSFKNPNAKNS